MEHRALGRSGLWVSEIVYGNWLTHGETVRPRSPRRPACGPPSTRASPPSTPPTCTRRARPRSCSARRCAAQRRESLEIATKVCLPTGTGPNDRGLSRKHVLESCHASLRRLGTDYVDLYQAHRFDRATPLEETLVAFDDLVRQGKVRYIGVSEWTAAQICRRADARRRAGPGPSHRGQPAAIQHALAGHRAGSAAAVPARGHRADRLPAAGPGRPHRQIPARSRRRRPAPARPAGGRAPRFIGRVLGDAVLDRVQRLRPLADQAGLTMAQLAIAWTLQNAGRERGDHRRHPPGAGRRECRGGRRTPDARDPGRDRPDARRPGRHHPTKTADMFAVKPEWAAS